MGIKRTLSRLLIFVLLLLSVNLPVATAETSEQLIFHHPDHLSGASVDTDISGNVIESVDYYPYGEIRIDAKTTTYENKHKFTGKELDESDNLYYYGARYYDPSIGRFISADPVDGDLWNPQSQNKYSYVLNNPLKYVDPTGQSAESILQWSWTAGGFASQFDGPAPGPADLIGLGIGIIGTIAAGGAVIYELLTNDHEIKKDVQVGVNNAAKSIAGGSSTVDPSGKDPGNNKNKKDDKKGAKDTINKSIRSLEKQIEKHNDYIKNPTNKVSDFNSRDPRYQKGLIEHWKKEIGTFIKNIQKLKQKLKK